MGRRSVTSRRDLEVLARNALLSGRPFGMMVSPQEAAVLRARVQPAKGAKANARTAWARGEAKEREPGMPSPGADRSSALRRLLIEGRVRG